MVVARRRAGALGTFPTVMGGARRVFHASILLLRVLVAFQRGHLCLIFIFFLFYVHTQSMLGLRQPLAPALWGDVEAGTGCGGRAV